MSASNPGVKLLSEAALTIWRFVQRYPGAMTAEAEASVPPCVPGLQVHRVSDHLYNLRARGYLRREKVGSKCCFYVAATPPGADAPHGPVPDLVHPDRPLLKLERQAAPTRTHSGNYAQIASKAAKAAGAPAAPRQTPLCQTWTEPYLRDRPGMRPGALDYRQHPSRRGEDRVHCYARPAR